MTRSAGRWLLAASVVFHGYRLLTVPLVEDPVESKVRLILFMIGMIALSSQRLLARASVLRVPAAALAGVVIWSAVLDALLGAGVIYTRGTAWVLAGAWMHGLFAWVSTYPRSVASGLGRVSARVVLLIGAVLLSLAWVETGTRWFVPIELYEPVPDDPGEGSAFTRAENGRIVGRPGFRGRYMHPEFPGVRVDLDRRGFRDDLEEPDPPRDPWVLVLGDSFVFGCGVSLEDTFQEQLEARLADLANPPQLMAAAVPGYGQLQQRDLLASLLDEGLRPRVVIVAIYEGNDPEDNINAGAIEAGIRSAPQPTDGEEVARKVGGEPGVARRYLNGLTRPEYWRGSSVAVQVLLPRVERTLVRLGWIEPFVASNQMLAYTMVREPPEPIQIALHWTRVLIRQIDERCRSAGADLVVLMIPAAIQAEPARYEQFLARVTEKDRYAFDRVATHQRLVDGLREDGVTVVDPLPALTERALPDESAYHREGHWNRRGHAIAAEVLETVLRERLQSP